MEIRDSKTDSASEGNFLVASFHSLFAEFGFLFHCLNNVASFSILMNVLLYHADIMEQNIFMETFGKCGIVPATSKTWRRILMGIAVVCTVVGWGALIAADFA